MATINIANHAIPILTGPGRVVVADLLADTSLSTSAHDTLRQLLDAGAIVPTTKDGPSTVECNGSGVILSALRDAVRRTHNPTAGAKGGQEAWWRCVDAMGRAFWMTGTLPASAVRMVEALAQGLIPTRELQTRLNIADAPARLRELRAMGIRIAVVRMVGGRDAQRDADPAADDDAGGAAQARDRTDDLAEPASPAKANAIAPRLLLLSEVRFTSPPAGTLSIPLEAVEQRASGFDAWRPQVIRDGQRAGAKQRNQFHRITGAPARHPLVAQGSERAEQGSERAEQRISAAVERITQEETERLLDTAAQREIARGVVGAAARQAKGDPVRFLDLLERRMVNLHTDLATTIGLAVWLDNLRLVVVRPGAARPPAAATAALDGPLSVLRALLPPGVALPRFTTKQADVLARRLGALCGAKTWAGVTDWWLTREIARRTEAERLAPPDHHH